MKTPNGLSFDQDDIVDPENFEIFDHCYVLHEHGSILAIVCADSEQDALDYAAEAGHLMQFEVSGSEEADYPNGDGLSYLGPDSVPHDIEVVEITQVPKPKRIFTWD